MAEELPEDIDTKIVSAVSRLYLPVLTRYHRAKFYGFENIPDKPFLAAGNHSGIHFMPESLLWYGKYYSMEPKIQMMTLSHNITYNAGKFLKLPLKNFGIIEANPETALNALKAGYAVTVYPGSDQDNSKPYSERNHINFFGHIGYVKLALKAQVPILPVVGVGGAETLFVLSSGEKFAETTGLKKWLKLHTWPVYWSFPFGWHVGHLPYFSVPLPAQITISVLPPYSLKKYKPADAENPETVQQINDEILAMMQEEMDKLTKGRIPIIG